MHFQFRCKREIIFTKKITYSSNEFPNNQLPFLQFLNEQIGGADNSIATRIRRNLIDSHKILAEINRKVHESNQNNSTLGIAP